MSRRLLLSGVIAFALAQPVAGQVGSAVAGGADFLLPSGARTLGMGLAGVTTASGAEALWWNPALIANGRRELALHTVSGLIVPESDLTVGFVYPVPRVMTVALGVRYINMGQGEAGESEGIQTGSFVSTDMTFTASVAASFANRIAAGMSLKVLRISFNCTGVCPNAPQNSPTTGAIDVGATYALTTDSTFVVGAALRNIGLPIQFNDSPQADALPGRLSAGIQFAPRFPQQPDLRIRTAIDFTTVVSGGGSGIGVGIGGEASWLERYHGRAGYILNGPTGSGPTVGVGGSFTRWRIDFAQFLSNGASDVGVKPTFFSVRYVF